MFTLRIGEASIHFKSKKSMEKFVEEHFPKWEVRQAYKNMNNYFFLKEKVE